MKLLPCKMHSRPGLLTDSTDVVLDDFPSKPKGISAVRLCGAVVVQRAAGVRNVPRWTHL